ncbi:uncharacterized protein DUF1018 [Agrobacterium vitis]|nr:uncharacterized protein DUF1018 [Agrobacterium vitis]
MSVWICWGKTAMPEQLTSKHYAILRVAKTQLGLSDENYRSILRRITGEESAKSMDQKGFTKLMAHFEILGFKSSSAKKDAARRPGMASQAQLRKITALWSQFTEGTGDDTSLRHWMEKHGHGHGLTWLEKEGAQKVIAALSAMIDRKKHKQG